MSVSENLAMDAYTRQARSQLEETMKRVFALFPILKQNAGAFRAASSGLP